jgi:hypothetical protein
MNENISTPSKLPLCLISCDFTIFSEANNLGVLNMEADSKAVLRRVHDSRPAMLSCNR